METPSNNYKIILDIETTAGAKRTIVATYTTVVAWNSVLDSALGLTTSIGKSP
jgi:hypothetical protein